MSYRIRWAEWSRKFAARPLRERQILGGGICASLFLLMFALVVDPAEIRNRHLSNTLAQQRADGEKLAAEVAALRAQQRDPDAGNRALLAQTRERIAQVERELKNYENLVVAPGRMPQVLRSLLARHPGLEVVSFKTLPVSPLVGGGAAANPGAMAGSLLRKLPGALSSITGKTGLVPGAPAQPATSDNRAAELADSVGSGGMYRHGIELTVSGSYADLLAYAAELQRISPRPLWSGMQLKVVQYPRSELTLVLYTLSLDLPWLAV